MQLNTSEALVAAGNRVTAVYRGSNVVYALEPVAPATGLFLGSQPQDATAVNGQAEFVANATEAGGGTVSYQWQRKPAGGAFANITGATSDTLSLSGLTSANDGDAHRAVITGSSGSTFTTREATLTVPPPLSITQQPTSQTAVNRAASFSVTAAHSGGLSISYQWQESADGEQWGNLPGGTSATLSFLSVPYEYDGKQYRVVLSSPDGETITSFTAVLTVPPSSIQIIQQPTSQTAVNRSATFSVGAAHSQALPMTYQWEESLDGGNVWYVMEGMTGAQLQIVVVPYDHDGRMYRVVVASGSDYAISAAAVLTVPPPPVSITAQPQSVSITEGDNASFSVQATHSQGLALSYLWSESDDGGEWWYIIEEPSATTNVLTLAAVPIEKDGTLIRAEVSDADGEYATSNAVALNVAERNNPPSDITLSATSIAENAGPNAHVAWLGTVDVDDNTFTYALVSGAGSTDNAAFNISGDQLRATASFDFETKSSYSIRVRSTEQRGQFIEKAFTITVTDVAEPPPGSYLAMLRGNYTGSGTQSSPYTGSTRSIPDKFTSDLFRTTRAGTIYWRYQGFSVGGFPGEFLVTVENTAVVNRQGSFGNGIEGNFGVLSGQSIGMYFENMSGSLFTVWLVT